jgi:hypothetical protein
MYRKVDSIEITDKGITKAIIDIRKQRGKSFWTRKILYALFAIFFRSTTGGVEAPPPEIY